MNDVSHHEATMRFLYGYVVYRELDRGGGKTKIDFSVYSFKMGSFQSPFQITYGTCFMRADVWMW